MPGFSSVHIIFNPNSTGNARLHAEQLQADLAKRRPKLAVTLVPTEYAGHAEELSYDIAKRHKSPLIVSSSGDGGYHEVINGAVRAQRDGASPVCAVLPAGNANDHARTMQRRPLADQIVRGDISQLDLLQLTTHSADGKEIVRYAHAYIGLGLTPTVAVELNKHTLNSLREAWIVIRTFWRLRPVVIERRGKRFKIDSLICSTIPQMAKLLTLSGGARPDDGVFELTLLRHNKKLHLLRRLLRGVFGDMGAHSREHSYAFRLLQAAPIQLDGEVTDLAPNTDVEIAVAPRLLRTVV